jgi:acyl-CoA-binding protein
MSDLDTDFATAAEEVKQLPEKPDNTDLLRLYALFKQGTEGDVTGDRPGMMDFVGRAKYDAWKDLTGTAQDDAKRTYIDLVEQLKAR